MTDDDMPKMTMLYKVTSGLVQEEDYGIKLARAIGFPARFIDTAVAAANHLKIQAEAKKQDSQTWKVTKRRKLVLTLREMLQQAHDSQMSEPTLASYLQRLQVEFIARMEAIETGAPEDADDGEEEAGSESKPQSSSVVSAHIGRSHPFQDEYGNNEDTAIFIEDDFSHYGSDEV